VEKLGCDRMLLAKSKAMATLVDPAANAIASEHVAAKFFRHELLSTELATNASLTVIRCLAPDRFASWASLTMECCLAMMPTPPFGEPVSIGIEFESDRRKMSPPMAPCARGSRKRFLANATQVVGGELQFT